MIAYNLVKMITYNLVKLNFDEIKIDWRGFHDSSHQ